MSAAYHGILNLDKPRGWTSHDVVARVRRLLGGQAHRGRGSLRVGHTGTLDPLATGVLLVCVGHATRVAEYLAAGEKVYRAAAQLGIATDTYDVEGQTLAVAPVPPLERQEIERALAAFRGEILQTPPPYSAIKLDGVPAYRKARRGDTVELAPRRAVIHRLELLDWESPRLTIEVACDPGTYIRSLVHDLGRALGCGATLAELTRLRSGAFRLQDAMTLDELAAAVEEGRVADLLAPLEAALGGFERVPVDGEAVERLAHGQAIPGPAVAANRPGYAVGPDGILKAILAYDAAAGLWRPKKVFLPES